MKIERKRYVVMRKNRTEIWGGLAQHYRFRPISDIGEFAIKTYRTEKQAHTCSSWDRDFEVVEVIETLESTEGYRKQEWISVDKALPEQNGRYLTHCNIENQSLVCVLYYSKIGGFNEGTVTHWMPLPEAPKMKGE